MPEIIKDGRRLVIIYIATIIFIAATYYLFTTIIPNRLATVQNGTAVSSNTTIYGYSNEILRASGYGVGVGAAQLSCSISSQCNKLLVSPCNNNIPAQFICINNRYYGHYLNITRDNNKNAGVICPMFLTAGSIGCSCISSYCAETYSR